MFCTSSLTDKKMLSKTVMHFLTFTLIFRHIMAVPFENGDFVLSAKQATHINDWHVDMEKAPTASKFYLKFTLTATLAFLTGKTWMDREDFVIIKSGYKTGHATYYMYAFEMKKVIATCPRGSPTKQICICCSYNPKIPDKFRIISACPFLRGYNNFLKKRKLGLSAY